MQAQIEDPQGINMKNLKKAATNLEEYYKQYHNELLKDCLTLADQALPAEIMFDWRNNIFGG